MLIGVGRFAGRRASAPVNAVAPHTNRSWLGWELTPREWASVVAEIGPDLARCGGRIVINPERDWRTASDEEARALCDALREQGARVIVVASYGLPQGFPSFPWAGFAEGADAGLALTYDRRDTDRPGYVAESVSQWRERGFDRVLVSASTWHQAQRQTKPAAAIRAELADRQPVNTVVWAPALPGWLCTTLQAWAAGRPLPGGPGSAPSPRQGRPGGFITVIIGAALALGALARSR